MIPFRVLFIFMIFVSSIMAVSASGWMGVWVALELNMLCLMPFMGGKGMAKYFLAQSVGSAMLLAGFALGLDIFVFMGGCIKAGVAPFHLWFIDGMKHLPWVSCMILATWQKVAPLSVIITSYSTEVAGFMVYCGMVFGAIGVLKQSSLRGLFAYSSVMHMGWVFAANSISLSLALFYFFVYCLTAVLVFSWMSIWGSSVSVVGDMSFIWLLCSFGGLPPLVGFIPKLFVFMECGVFFFIPLFISSVIMAFVYSGVVLKGVWRESKGNLSLVTFSLMTSGWFFSVV